MTLQTEILAHFEAVRTITIRDAVINYGISGGTFTKIVSNLRREQYRIVRTWNTAPTGTRYASYTLVEHDQQDQGRLAI